MALSQLATSSLAVIVTCWVLTMVAVTLRFIARRLRKAALLWDDWMVVVAMMSNMGDCILITWAISAGIFGVETDQRTAEKSTMSAKVDYASPFFTIVSLTTIKISVVCFYKRIFITKRFHLVSNCIIVFAAGWGISSFWAQLFQQWPIRANWSTVSADPASNELLDYGAFTVAVAGIDLAMDIFIVSMPAFVIRKLQLDTKRKIAITAIFLLGSISVVADAIRIYYQYLFFYDSLNSASHSTDVIVDTVIWSIIEPSVSIVAACLPMLGPLFTDNHRLRSKLRRMRSRLHLRPSRRGGAAAGAATTSSSSSSYPPLRLNSNATGGGGGSTTSGGSGGGGGGEVSDAQTLWPSSSSTSTTGGNEAKHWQQLHPAARMSTIVGQKDEMGEANDAYTFEMMPGDPRIVVKKTFYSSYDSAV